MFVDNVVAESTESRFIDHRVVALIDSRSSTVFLACSNNGISII